MTWQRPAPVEVWRAVEAYLALAYTGAPPPAVAERLSQLRAASEAAFYDSPAFEQGEDRYALRLGNRFYPHMKLAVEGAPGGLCIYRADTHDRHFLGMVDAADPGLVELMARNQTIARAIEDAWSACGLATTRGNLRQQLARRRASRP